MWGLWLPVTPATASHPMFSHSPISICILLFLFFPFSDQGCLWLDQSQQVHIQDQPATGKVTDFL